MSNPRLKNDPNNPEPYLLSFSRWLKNALLSDWTIETYDDIQNQKVMPIKNIQSKNVDLNIEFKNQNAAKMQKILYGCVGLLILVLMFLYMYQNYSAQNYWYCWNDGAANPHHLGYKVSDDHLCSRQELLEAGMGSP